MNVREFPPFVRLAALLAGFALIGSCSGGEGSISTTPPPPPPPAATPSVTVSPVYTQLTFNRPTALMQAPQDSGRWFVVQQGGQILQFVNDLNVSNTGVFLDISPIVNAGFSESGLLGLAFHPTFPVTPFVYVSYTASGNPLISRISRFQSANNGQFIDPASEQILLEVLQPFSNHNGGNLAFGPDGFLYAGFGDGGSGGDPQNNAQTTSNLLGTIVRIDIDSAIPYAIPASNPNAANPFCTQGFGAAPCPEIFAWGLRNPWKFSFDSATGDLWAADVGQVSWEEVDLVVAGGNYGWREREGAHCFNPSSGCSTAFDEPVAEYPRSVGQSVTGGFVYRGSSISSLFGWYVFGDFGSGRLLGFEASSPGVIVPTEFDNTQLSISTFAEGLDGELYLMDYGSGTIFQVVGN